MPVIINGTTGVTSVNGTAAAPSVTGTDTDTGIVYGTNTVTIATNGTAAAVVNSTQGVQFNYGISVGGTAPATEGSGVKFPATQVASTDANTLDDYEEGTFTPTMAGATFSLSTSVGRYIKIGKSVTVWVGVQGTYSSPTVSFSINNLPFTVGGDLTLYARPVGAMSTLLGISFTGSICCEVLNGYTSMYFEDNLGSGARSDLNSSNFASGGFRYEATVTYETSA